MYENIASSVTPRPLYTPEERVRRDATRWTIVQGVLAPVQFLALIVSVILVVRFLQTGEGETVKFVGRISCAYSG